ncbi:hypothetical protein FKG94_20565 [Exilibacterium tricleocarpae]|uniref:Uncharacterized protein n=1 Tax=Exilibacterium tricleocarpae TaxID=2591008 RepID=A0A545T0H9_9GAMM|nr:hypothetical protein [Exilibacterium tricleocarpae]TQV70725.1 hypothetical protein FKG94_20565 [Exilibacterium tricleocarpae]
MHLLIFLILVLLVILFFSRTQFYDKDKALERKLLKMCNGDRALLQRLLDHETKAKPGIDRLDAVRAAVRRLKRDRK